MPDVFTPLVTNLKKAFDHWHPSLVRIAPCLLPSCRLASSTRNMGPQQPSMPPNGVAPLTPADSSSGLLSPASLVAYSPEPEDSCELPAVISPVAAEEEAKKKKKKKKAKKPAKGKSDSAEVVKEDAKQPPVLCISRNKHWKYISSYHVRVILYTLYFFMADPFVILQGPWLQLPLELLESLLLLNLDPATVSASEARLPPLSSPPPTVNRLRDRSFSSMSSLSPPDSPESMYASMTMPPPFPTPQPGKAAPPPIDPGVFKSVASIRKLIDEASELSVRASSGLSAAALGSMRSNSLNLSGSPWSAVQSLGINPMGDFGGGGNGRNVMMSATRVHRLRVLAVQKLAAAYKADEIASSVMVMQGGSVFEDIAEKVLKIGEHHAVSGRSSQLTLELQSQIMLTLDMCTSFTRKFLPGTSITPAGDAVRMTPILRLYAQTTG